MNLLIVVFHAGRSIETCTRIPLSIEIIVVDPSPGDYEETLDKDPRQ